MFLKEKNERNKIGLARKNEKKNESISIESKIEKLKCL